MTTKSEPDPKKLLAKIGDIGGLAFGARIAAMVYLGVKMGLYRSLKATGPVTSVELAERTGFFIVRGQDPESLECGPDECRPGSEVLVGNRD